MKIPILLRLPLKPSALLLIDYCLSSYSIDRHLQLASMSWTSRRLVLPPGLSRLLLSQSTALQVKRLVVPVGIDRIDAVPPT